MIKKLISIAVLLLSVGCQSNPFIESREFQVSKYWTFQNTSEINLKYRKINRMSTLIGDGYVVQGNGIDGISAYNTENGSKLWSLKIEEGVEASGALVNDKLYFGSQGGQFYSVNAKTGTILWTFPTRIENLSEPLVVDGVVYFLTGSNTVYALKADTGESLWLYSRPEVMPVTVRGGAKPTMRKGALIVGFSDGTLVSLEASSGKVKWEKQLNNGKRFRDLDSDPLVVEDDIFVTGFDDSIYKIRAATGEIVWKSEFGGYGNLVSYKDLVLFATSSSEFIALNVSSGSKVWTYKLPQSGIATGATLFKNYVVFGDSNSDLVFADAITGQVIQKFTPGRGIMSRPTVDEKLGRVYFISGNASFYSLRASWEIPQKFGFLK